MAFQNDVEHLKDLMQRGEMTAAQANVELVRIQRYRLVTSPVSADVRKALNAAVKAGVLGHMKKDGHKPECYFHPTFDYLAKGARRQHEDNVLRSVAKVAGFVSA